MSEEQARPGISHLPQQWLAAGDIQMADYSAAFLSTANAVAPVAGGALFQGIGPAAPFILGGLLMGVLLLLAVRLIKPGQEEEEPAGLARGGGH